MKEIRHPRVIEYTRDFLRSVERRVIALRQVAALRSTEPARFEPWGGRDGGSVRARGRRARRFFGKRPAAGRPRAAVGGRERSTAGLSFSATTHKENEP